jgi:hypothetical protein
VKPWRAGCARGLVVRGGRGGLGNLVGYVVRQGGLADKFMDASCKVINSDTLYIYIN